MSKGRLRLFSIGADYIPACYDLHFACVYVSHTPNGNSKNKGSTYLLGGQCLGGEVVDTVGEAALDQSTVQLQEVLHLLCHESR